MSSDVQAEDAAKPADKNKVTYVDHVQPILRQHCFTCHNPDKKTNGLDLTTYAGIMQGGAAGTAIEAGSASESYLFMLVNHESEPHMPPNSDKLPEPVVATIRQWIDGGALETAGSKAMIKKPKVDLSLSGAPTGRPEGPPPMPGRLNLEPVVRTGLSTAVTALATNPWSPLAAIGGQNQVLLYHTKTLQPLGVLPFPEGVPEVLTFSRNGKLLLAGGGHGAAAGRVIVWSLETGERIIEVGDELDSVLAADISADQKRVALGGPGRVVRIYSTADGTLLHEIRKHTDWVYSVSFSPDGVLLATADRNGGMFVWETETAREYLALRGHTAAITGLSWRADSNILASASEDGTVRLWEVENGGQVKSWNAHGGVTSIEFAHNGNLVSSGRDRAVKLWDQNGKEIRAFPSLADIALRVTFCDESNRVIAGDWTGAIRVWNADDASQVGELTANPPLLEERLAQATQAITARQAEQTQHKAALDAVQAENAKIAAAAAAAQKAAAEAQANAQAAEAAVKTLTERVAQLTAQHDGAAQAAATLEPTVPLLKESADKAQTALEKAPADKELAQTADQLKALFANKSAALETAKKTQVESGAGLEKTKPELAAAEKQLADAKAAVDPAAKRAAELAPSAKAAADKLAAAQNAYDGVTQALATAQADVGRWTEEIAFSKKLKVIAERRAEQEKLEMAAAEAQAALDKLNADLAAANKTIAEAKQLTDSATADVAAAEKASAGATAAEAAAGGAVSAQAGVLPALNESLAKADEAAKKAPEDKEVAAAKAQLKTLVDARAAALEAAKKDLAAKTAAAAAGKQALEAARKQSTDLAATIEGAPKRVAEIQAAIKPAQDQLAQAKQAAASAAQEVEALKAELAQPATRPTQTASTK